MQPDSLIVDLEPVLQHQSTGFLQVLASDPHGGPSIDAGEFATIHRVLRTYFRLVLIDTVNCTRAVNWQESIRVADVVVVPLKLRYDHMVPAARMIRALLDAGEDLTGRLVLVLSCGPDDRHMSGAEQAQLFAEFGLETYPLLEVPSDRILNTARLLRWADLAPATQAAYRRLGALVVELANASTTLPDTFSIEQTGVDGTGLGLEVVKVLEAPVPWTQQVVGLVDDGLDAQGAAVLEVLLDPGVLVVGVHGDPDGVAGVDPGLVGRFLLGGPAPAAGMAGEDHLDVVGSADVEVVGDQGLEERPGPPGGSNTRVREVSICRIDSSHQ